MQIICRRYESLQGTKEFSQGHSNLKERFEYTRADWSTEWQLSPNTTKCEAMRMSKKNDTSCREYYIGANKLDQISETKDLGIYVTSNLSWSLQVTKINVQTKLTGFLALLDVLFDQHTQTCCLNYIKALLGQSLNIVCQYVRRILRKISLL